MREISARFIVTIILYCGGISCTAQSISGLNGIAIIGGFGNYELVHGGVQLSIHQYFFEGAIGIKPWNFNQDRYVVEYIGVGRTLFQTPHMLKAGFQLKLLHWNYNDDYTRISVLSIAPEAKLSQAISAHVQLAACGGIIYNDVLSYERKTYQEVGWLNRFSPSFSLQLQYWLR